jgi:hypothetical protein
MQYEMKKIEMEECMYDGLWTVEFGSMANRYGRGVLIFINGRLLGGDDGYYYSGNYEIKRLQSEVKLMSIDSM